MPIRVCKHLTDGTHKDCRECNAFKAKDEITELGSVLVGMARSLHARSELAEAIAEGDLTQDVTVASENDQLGHALRVMLEGLREMVGSIQNAVSRLPPVPVKYPMPARHCLREQLNQPVFTRRSNGLNE